MIDIELLRKNPDLFRTSMAKRNMSTQIIDDFLALDKEWREATAKSENMRAEQKKLGAARDIEGAKKIKEELVALFATLETLDKKRHEIALSLPNLLSPDVPEGKDETENKIVRTWGKPTEFDFTPLDHMALGEKLGIVDNVRAAKVTAARFTYLKGGAAQLQLALMNFVFATLTDPTIIRSIAEKIGVSEKPFTPIFPPMMINPEIYTRMARLSPETKEERYHIPSDDLYLIGSAEHTMGSMYADEVLPAESLPIRYIGYSTSFRREAGAAGKDTHGILRLHQFDKLEMESFSTPETSAKEHEFFVAIQEYLLQSLEIPYRVMAICGGDMGKPDYQQTDIDAWLPGQKYSAGGEDRLGRYRETHTADYMTDYQSRRLGTKYRPIPSSPATAFVHMNDATAFAIGRTLIAIIENYQTKEGTIRIPKVLQKYTGITEIK